MAATETYQVPLGYQAPFFELIDVRTGKKESLTNLRGEKATVMMFICNHCPYVIHVRTALLELARDYMPLHVRFIAISSNDADKYPDDAPEKMKQLAEALNFPFPYLYDETQEVAKAYFAACTPDFSIFDANMACVYRGQLDDSRPKNQEPVNGKDIRAALDALLENQPPLTVQKPSIGCNIKWKPGNNPF